MRSARKTIWVPTLSWNQTVTTGASVAQAVVTEANIENFPDPTLVRIRGELLVMMTASAATPGRCLATMGLIKVSAAALAGASVPLPSTDQASDWIWWQTVALELSGGSVAAPNSDGRSIVKRIEIDSKAMRKFSQNEVLIFVSENLVATSTQTFDVLGGARCLFKR